MMLSKLFIFAKTLLCATLLSTKSCKNIQTKESVNNHFLYISSRVNDSLANHIKSIEAESFTLTIRSSGGDTDEASNLGIFLTKKNLSVEVHDFCHSACAEFILPAANKVVFLDNPLVGFHWNPMMDYYQYLNSETDISSCTFNSLENQKALLINRNLNLQFWRETEKRLKLTQFKLIDVGEDCPWKIRKFKNQFWLPTSEQLKSLWGLKFDGALCADDFERCKTKVDDHWSKGKRIVIGDEVYVSKGL